MRRRARARRRAHGNKFSRLCQPFVRVNRLDVKDLHDSVGGVSEIVSGITRNRRSNLHTGPMRVHRGEWDRRQICGEGSYHYHRQLLASR